MGLFIFWGIFSARRVFNRACVIILDGYPHFHLLVLYITRFVIFPLHFPVLSIQCFMLFSLSSSLYYHTLSLSIFPFSVLLRADFPMRCRRGGTQIREGITEKTSPVTNVSLAMLLPDFCNWSFWSHEWKMTIFKALTDTKQVGESYSQAIRNLVQILKCWSAVGLPAPVIKSFNPESTPSGKNNPWVLFSVFIWSEIVR